MDEQRREQVRERYAYCCGYCGVHEADVGSTLTVDHHRPQRHGGTDDNENIVYCCPRCNEHKGAYWHEVHAPRIRLLHPLDDKLDLHFLEEQTGQLVGQTPEGVFYIHRLHLNRPQLIEHRLCKRADQRVLNEVNELRQQLRDLQQQMSRLHSSFQETMDEIERETIRDSSFPSIG
jgi:hypothetical protein